MNKTKSSCSYLLEVCWRIFAGLCPEQWRWRTPRAFQCVSPPSAFLWSSPLWSTSCHTWKHKASVRDMNNYVLDWSLRGSQISSTLNVNCVTMFSDRTKWCGCLDLDGSQTGYGLVHSHAACMRSLHSDAECVWHVWWSSLRASDNFCLCLGPPAWSCNFFWRRSCQPVPLFWQLQVLCQYQLVQILPQSKGCPLGLQ